jgi:hypothetical protein
LDVVASDDSNGAVTWVSTSSGLAPTSVVITITYGKLIFGNRSAVIFVIATIPNTIIATTPTRTVNGRFTLYFDNTSLFLLLFYINNIGANSILPLTDTSYCFTIPPV